MARFFKKLWIPKDMPDVAQAQTITANSNIILNGSLYDYDTKEINIIKSGSSRNLAFVKNTQTIAGKFTIYGTQNGVEINEILSITAGADIAYSIKIYDTISKIVCNLDNNITAIGLGQIGFFPLIKLNPDISPSFGGPFWALQVVSDNVTTTFTCKIYQSVDEIYQNNQTFKDQIDNNQLFEIPILRNDPAQNVILQSGYNYDIINQTNNIRTNNPLFYTNEFLLSITVNTTGALTLTFRQT